MSIAARALLCSLITFKDEHDGTAVPTSRADLMDPAVTQTSLIALALDVARVQPYEVTAVRRNHHDDGPNGHAGGRGFDAYFTEQRGMPEDWLDPGDRRFRLGLLAARHSPWMGQIGLAGDADTPANFACIGGTGAQADGSAFHDTGGDHIHFGSIAS